MLACTPSKAISTTSSGRTVTTQSPRSTASAEQPLGLPGEHLVGEALERLAEHDEPAGRVARAEVQVGQPALAPAVAPLDREHDQVERVPRLDLDPGRAAPADVVGRLAALTTTPSWPASSAAAKAASASASVSTRSGATRMRRRHAPRRAPPTAPAGLVEQSVPSRCSRSKKNGVSEPGAEPGRPARGLLERPGPPGGVDRQRLAVEHEPPGGQRARRRRRSRAPGR